MLGTLEKEAAYRAKRYRHCWLASSACIVWLAAMGYGSAQAASRQSATTNSSTLYPIIRGVHVAFRTLGTNHGWPYNTSHVVVKAVIVATVNGETRAYADLGTAPQGESNWPGGWHREGEEGAACPRTWPTYHWMSDLGYGTIYQWNTSAWGTPTFTWKERLHNCYEFSKTYGRKYKYLEDTPSWSGWGTANAGVNLLWGIKRYQVSVSYKGQTKASPDNERATRISVRWDQDFGIVGTDSDSVLRKEYLRWIFAYLDEPYEYGGQWFGGRACDTFHYDADGGYDGYGIDCSGLVSNAARWAGYNWISTDGGWRRAVHHTYTSSLSYVSDEVTDLDDVVCGDIMVIDISQPNVERHVRSIYCRCDDTIWMIAAEGNTQSVVKILPGRSLDHEHSNNYVPRHLTAY